MFKHNYFFMCSLKSFLLAQGFFFGSASCKLCKKQKVFILNMKLLVRNVYISLCFEKKLQICISNEKQKINQNNSNG